MRINEDNFFEIAEAIHCFCALNHSGQTCKFYSILSQSEFKPGPFWSESKVEKENDFYSELTEENVEEIFEQLKQFLNSKGNKK